MKKRLKGKRPLLVLAMLLPVVVVMAALARPVPYDVGVSYAGVATVNGVVALVDVLSEMKGVKAKCPHERRPGYEVTVVEVDYQGATHVVRVDHAATLVGVFGLENWFSATSDIDLTCDPADKSVYRRTGNLATRLSSLNTPTVVTDEMRELSDMIHSKVVSVAQVKYRPMGMEYVEKWEVKGRAKYNEMRWKLGEWWKRVRP